MPTSQIIHDPVRRAIVTGSAMAATLMMVVDSTIAQVALPHIQSSMSASQDQAIWVLTSYLIAASISTPLSAWLAGRFGRKRIMMIAVAGFPLSSLACGIAENLTFLVVARILQGLFGAENLRFPSGLVSEETLSLGGLHLTALDLGIILLSFALMAVLLLALKKTQLGRALRAIAESPKAAYLLGINVEGLFLLTSFAAAALGGLAGVLIGLYSNALFPLMGQPMLHKGIAVIILGGMGDIRGALLGGLFLGFAEVLSVAYIGSSMRDAVAFGLLFLILLVRPKGLFGSQQERKV